MRFSGVGLALQGNESISGVLTRPPLYQPKAGPAFWETPIWVSWTITQIPTDLEDLLVSQVLEVLFEELQKEVGIGQRIMPAKQGGVKKEGPLLLA